MTVAAPRTTKCLLCKVRMRCVLVNNVLIHVTPRGLLWGDCRDPAARNFAPSRPPRKKKKKSKSPKAKKRGTR